MSFFIVTGLSGSGKSLVLQTLEDMGFYCIDNLPAALLPHFAELLEDKRGEEFHNAAVGLDVRNRDFLENAPESLNTLQAKGLQYRIIYLQAEESALVTRFKETRRKHPLTNDSTSLLEAVRLEQTLLEPLAFRAAKRFDTTHTSPHELRSLIRDFARGADTGGMTLQFESFGFKHGMPIDADYVFDVRCLPNPFWQLELRPHSGLEDPVIRYLDAQAEVGAMLEQIKTFLQQWLPSFERENRSYMTVAIGCTGGKHRSVYLVERLAAHFSAQGINTQIRHRELS